MFKLVSAAGVAAALASDPIIGGQGAFRYQYMPGLLKPPAGADMTNCHGLATDKDQNIYLTYDNSGGSDPNCLIRWRPDGTGGEFMTGGGTTLCSGVAHGLSIATEGSTQYLYHANNGQKLTKTALDGTVLWQVNGTFTEGQPQPYRPTWLAPIPGSDKVYLCDGYGSDRVYVFDTNGKFLNKTYGGKGGREQHGKFSINHACTWNVINDRIGVSDRANSRIEYYKVDGEGSFDFDHTVDMRPSQGAGTLPCSIRTYPEHGGRSIIADLAGPVQILDNNKNVISVVNVSGLLGEQEGTKHPHDAMFLANGDFIVAAWAPGRVTYWKKLPAETIVV